MSLALVACGSADAPTEVTQTITIDATEYAFVAAAPFTITAGETVRAVMNNKGNLVHEMQVLDENGRLIDRVGRIEPGASGDVVVSFDEPGIYQLICDVDDHLTRGQRARFLVEEAAG